VQFRPAAHTVPQLPQLFPSVAVFEQVPEQLVGVLFAHTQVPPLHTRLLPQVTEHIPQLLLSELRLAQLLLLHATYPEAQLAESLTHMPAPLHLYPVPKRVEQLVPHAPQFELSLFRSTQPDDEVPGIWSPAIPPPHCVRPVGHAHCPLVQATPPAQVVPHEPQLRLLVCVSTHAVVLLPNVVDVHAVPPSPH
jgi:hypothetical protein